MSSCVFVSNWFARRRIGASQKLLSFALLPTLLGRSRSQCLHLLDLVFGELRQMPDDVDEMPCRFLAVGRTVRPARHSGESDTVLDDVEQLAVSELLCCREAHVRRFRTQAATHLGVAAAIAGMT